MLPSPQCIAMIRHFEGCELVPYKDQGGLWTVGYGHLMTEGDDFASITPEQAESLLQHDIERIALGVEEALLNVQVNQNQFDALVCFVFNIGLEAFEASTLLKLIKHDELMAAAAEFSRWDHVHAHVDAGLRTRRRAEAELFLLPVVTVPV